MPTERNNAVAVIGAGVAGLTCARVLREAGAEVSVFEKSRGLGGRMATRRVGTWRFDHGAQYFTAKSEPFRRYVDAHPSIETWHPRGGDSAATWYVGTPAQGRAFSTAVEGCSVHTQALVESLHFSKSDGWSVGVEGGRQFDGFAAVAMAMPAPQAVELVESMDAFVALRAVSLLPCWALMLVTERSVMDVDVMRDPCPEVAWLAANHSKPGRGSSTDAQYVLHATPHWSLAHLELDADVVQPMLVEHFRACVARDGEHAEILHAAAHRWRYALVDDALGQACLFDHGSAIGVAGDWCLGGRVEAAFTSGAALGEHIARRVSLPVAPAR